MTYLLQHGQIHTQPTPVAAGGGGGGGGNVVIGGQVLEGELGDLVIETEDGSTIKIEQ